MLTIGKAYFSITFTMVLHRRQFGDPASLRGTKQSSRKSKDCFVVPPRNDAAVPPRNDVEVCFLVPPRNDGGSDHSC